jgi:uncharacterized membrane protein
MDDAATQLLILLFFAIVLAIIILPIIALIVSLRAKRKVSQQLAMLAQRTAPLGPLPQTPGGSAEDLLKDLEARIARLEVALQSGAAPQPMPPLPQPAPPPEQPAVESSTAPPPPMPPPAPEAPRVTVDWSPFPRQSIKADQIESLIGRRWLGWAAVVIILFATAFFLKYAFDNRWIGELGRVGIGIIAGITLTVFGYRYHQRRWRIFAQILTAGGVVLLYLSTYAAFGYYHLAGQKTAFAFLAILIAETAGLALVYNAPTIAIMALIGGFLTPILLHSDRDQYRSLFGYILALDVGALVLLKHWPGLSSLAFAGTHLLFWLWYGDHYHPQKLRAVMIFQTAVFVLFLLAHMLRRLRRQRMRIEDDALLVINPFVFFAPSYYLLNPNHHDWMGAFAVVMALLFAGVARFLLDRSPSRPLESLLLIGVGLTFVTLAIPIQLKSNWITIAWAVEGVAMLWAGIETKSQKLRICAHCLFAIALFRLVFWDTPINRAPFTPIMNKYFLSSVVVTVCIFAAAYLYKEIALRKGIRAPHLTVVLLMIGIASLWFIMSVETFTFFDTKTALQRVAVGAAHQRWLGQMALSVLWSIYAAALAAIGFVRRVAAVRWAALSLFALTMIKAMLVDIAALQQLYRIIVFFVLGLLLLLVAWGYHKAFYAKESST